MPTLWDWFGRGFAELRFTVGGRCIGANGDKGFHKSRSCLSRIWIVKHVQMWMFVLAAKREYGVYTNNWDMMRESIEKIASDYVSRHETLQHPQKNKKTYGKLVGIKA